MSPIIVSFTENTDTTKGAAKSALRAAQTGETWMYEFRHYRVTDIAFEAGALVIRGDLIRSDRDLPIVAGATFSDSAA